MNEKQFEMNPNPLVRFLGKTREEFTREDIVRFCMDQKIELVNFRYIAQDGRLKTLTFVITSREHLETILLTGERVDGSSLFSFMEAGSSDLYVIPRYKTAFVNPFSDIPSLDILCSFYDSQGKPLESGPGYVLRKAHDAFRKATGYDFKCMGELEYYLITPREEENLYPARDQKGYHESSPYAKFHDFKDEAMRMIAACGGQIKYGHSEVGNFTDDQNYYEQQEIEFTPVMAEDAADQLVVAKWVLRRLADQYGILISFAPKITVGKAGSGLHIHMQLDRGGRNMMIQDGALSPDARKMIAGVLDMAAPLTAFGNTIPTSYLRLVPHQEAPTNICWGDRNRSTLIRVPLGWLGEAAQMVRNENPQDKTLEAADINKQTFEIRSGDGSCDIYLYIAGLIVASQRGLQMPGALEMADELYCPVNIFSEAYKSKLARLKPLPASCHESAASLEAARSLFEENGIFPPQLIDSSIRLLRSYNDDGLSERLYGNNDEIRKLVEQYLHCM